MPVPDRSDPLVEAQNQADKKADEALEGEENQGNQESSGDTGGKFRQG